MEKETTLAAVFYKMTVDRKNTLINEFIRDKKEVYHISRESTEKYFQVFKGAFARLPWSSASVFRF